MKKRSFIVTKESVESTPEKRRKAIKLAVKRAVDEYKEAYKRLAQE